MLMVYRQTLLLRTTVLFIDKYQYILKYSFNQCLTKMKELVISVKNSDI